MLIRRAYKYELDPNVAQRALLAKHAGAARFAYNWGLAQRIELYNKTKKTTNAIEQHKELVQLKKTKFSWLYEVSKCAPQEALRDLERAFKNFFEGHKNGRKVGFPRMRKKGKDDRFRLAGSIRVYNDKIRFPRIGCVRVKEKTKVQGRITSVTIRKEANRWFASLSVETKIPDPKPICGPIVGIDLGIACFATLVQNDNTTIKISAPKPLGKYLKLLKQRQVKHSRKRKGSENRRKSAIKLARLHWRIRNIRQDFLHKITTCLAKTKQAIVIEDLSVSGLLGNPKLARYISDMGWRKFRTLLEYKCRWYGSQLIIADQYFSSSKTCSNCGWKFKGLSLYDRNWSCPQCNTNHDRDINAARNLLNLVVLNQLPSVRREVTPVEMEGYRSQDRCPSMKQEAIRTNIRNICP